MYLNALLLAPLHAAPVHAVAPTAVVRDASRPVVVDGELDEADWALAPAVTDFVRYLPSAGGPHGSRTEVRFLQDDKNLYVGVRVSQVDTEVRAHISPREDVNVDDQVGIYLDPVGDARTGYIFYLNALGVQQDIRYAYGEWFMSWNTVFRSEGHVTDDGWVLEVAIPFRSLRYPRVDGAQGHAVQDWGLMLTRKIPAEGTKYSWPPMQPRHPRMFAQQGKLRGVRPGPAGAGVELIPVLAGRFAMDAGPDGDQPLAWTGLDPWHESLRPGLDARVGLTPDLGLTATVNPDFSQVEGDIRQIDLNQRFAFFYPERRPFFLDGISSFGDSNSTLYTRSIVDPLGGVKLSGRADRFNVGALTAVDRAPYETVHEQGTPGFGEADLADAWASNAFLRTRFDVLDNGFVGFTVGDKRILAGPEGGLAPTGAHSDVMLADAQLPLGEVWTAGGYGSVSAAGEPGDELVGGAGGVSLARSPPLGTGGQFGLHDRGPGYRNEMGFLNQSGISTGWADLYQRYALGEGGSIGQTSVGVSGWEERDADRSRAASVGQDFELTDNHTIGVTGGWQRWRFQGAEVDGWFGSGEYETLLNRAVGLEVGGSGARVLDFDELAPATDVRVDGEVNLRPSVSTRLDLFYAQQWFLPEGADREHLERIYGRFTWQLTRFLGVRAIGQTQTGTGIEDPTVQGSFLLTWLKHPGTEAYVGATWNVETDGRGLTEQVLFAKYSRLFRL